MSQFEKSDPPLKCKLTKRLLGKLLVDGEFIAPQDLERSLEQQVHTNELLGKILVFMGLLDPVDLTVTLSIQRDCASFENAIKLASGVRQLLGELLTQTKRITPQQLETMLHEQKLTGEKLGKALVDTGVLSQEELDGLLSFQEYQSDPLRADRLRLGQLLVATNQITREQLEDSLRRKRLSPHKKIGELLVEEGYATPEQVSHGLKLQRNLITAVLVAILSLTSPVSSVITPSEAASSGAQLTETETAAMRLNLSLLYQAPELVVTHADILKGYVEVKSASHIEISSNVLFFLRFEGLGEPFEEVYIQGLGREVLINKEGSFVFLPDIRGFATFELNYRFILSEDAQPGTYEWPLTISAHPAMIA